MARILIADGEESFVRNASSTLHLQGHEVVNCRSIEEAERVAKGAPVQLILADLRLEGGGGFELLDRIQRSNLRCGK